MVCNCGRQASKGKKDRPNILFIVTDDQGAWTLSAESYPNTHTPQIDKLAGQGVLMKNAFSVSAVCAPSRAALATGRYPNETGVLSNADIGVDTTLVLWPEMFKNAGYNTAMVGKWDLGEAYRGHHPGQRGFDRFAGFMQGGKQSKDPVVQLEGKDTVFTGQFTADVLTDLAEGYIEEFADESWVVCLHYWAPHANTRFPRGFSPPYDDRSWLPLKDIDLEHWKNMDLTIPNPDFPNLDTLRIRRMMREYYASVHSVDRNIGRLMDMLDSLGLADNTIVLFTSDHGYMMGQHGLWHKGNGRWITIGEKDPDGIYPENRPNLFDLSMRVPFIVRWPGKVKAGKKVENTITLMDCYPTLLDMAGIEKPDDLLLRGRSFYPVLKGADQRFTDTVFGQLDTLRSIRTPEWKFVYHFGDTTNNEFYHLAGDPGESNNLISSADGDLIRKRSEIRDILFDYMKLIKDPLLED